MKSSSLLLATKARLPFAFFLAVLITGCAIVDTPRIHTRRFLGRMDAYPRTMDPLKVRKLTGASATPAPNIPESRDVFIVVHPGYSLFFRDGAKSRSAGDAQYALLSWEFENEARFISEASRTGKTVVLIVPGNYGTESVSPLSYTAYLNQTAGDGPAVFYLSSVSSSNGTVSMNDMVDLYRFLQSAKAARILIGGGYIGRCQREFYNQLTTYHDKATAFIVPEISTISPDDISDAEAVSILERIQQGDFSLVRKFLDRKVENRANILSLPAHQL